MERDAEFDLGALCGKFKLEREAIVPSVETALRRAVVSGTLDDVYFLARQVGNINAQDDNPTKRKTALHWAVTTSKIAAIDILIAAGARADIKDAVGKTAVDYAAESSVAAIRTVFNAPDLVSMVTPVMASMAAAAEISKEAGASETKDQ